MKLEHVVIFLNHLSQYNVLTCFTEGVAAALERQGISCEFAKPDKQDLMPFLAKIYVNQPDCTLSFNGLLPNEFGDFLCDKLEIPHICCLVDSAHFFSSLANSPFNIITCPDEASCDVFHEMNFPNAYFMPHAVDRKLFDEPIQESRPYDAVFLGSCIDYLSILEKWEAKYPANLVKGLKEGAERVLQDPHLSYQRALPLIVNQEAIGVEEYGNLMRDFDLYIRGKDRIELIQSIKTADLHVFGESLGKRTFKDYLKSQENRIVFHPSVNYPEALKIMGQSKIILNSSPMFKKGGHERIFSGLALGAAVLTNETEFMLKNFKRDEEILLYNPKAKEEINENLKFFLSQESARKNLALRGREKVLKQHIWDNRIQDLVPKLEAAIEKIYED